MENNSPIARIIAVLDKLSFAANRYLCTKAREWMAAGGDPAGEYMEHLAQLAENIKIPNVCDFECKLGDDKIK